MAKTSENKTVQEASESLRRANRWLAVIYFAEAVAILVTAKRAEVAVTTNYLTPDAVQSTLANHTVLASATHRLFAVNVGYVVATALLVFACMYAAVATFWRARYETGLKKNANLARWTGFGAGFGLMLVAVAMLAGVYDFATLVMLFVLTLAMHVLGFVVEVLQGKNIGGRSLFGLGVALGVVALLLVGSYAVGAGLWGGGHLPPYVVWTFATLVAGFAAVGASLLMQRRGKDKWASYVYAERVYMIVGLAASSAVVWQIFAGALKP